MPQIPQGTYDLNSLLYNMGFGLQSQGQGAKNFLPEFGDEIYGQDYAYLTDLLKNIIGGQVDPALEKAQAAGERNISRGASEALQSTRERLAGTGVSGANIISDIFRNRADAQGNLAAQVGQMGMSARQAAIQNLLGYNQFAGQQSMAATGASANAYQQLLSSLLQNQQAGQALEVQREANEFDLGDAFGSLLGGGSTALFGWGLNQLSKG